MMRRAGITIFLGCLVLLAASFAGAIHPLGDSLSVFRYLIANGVMAGVVLAVRGRRRIVAILALIVGLLIEPISIAFSPLLSDPPGAYSLYQKNTLYANADIGPLSADIAAVAPDFVTLQELSRRNLRLLADLAPDYPTRFHCARSRLASIAILSRFERTEAAPICSDTSGFAAVQVRTPDGPVWAVVIHLRWPWPKTQPANVDEAVARLRALDGPVILAGDFNSVPWSYAMRRLARASGSDRVGPVIRTLVGVSPFLRVPIDHVLVPGGRGSLETRPTLGSDHLGLVARFDL